MLIFLLFEGVRVFAHLLLYSDLCYPSFLQVTEKQQQLI